MTFARESIESLNDARALLDTFRNGGWQTAVIRVGTSEFALSRDGLLERVAAVPTVEPAGREPAAAATLYQAKAPHVATLVEIAAVGAFVAKGDRLAVLSVLDEQIDFPSPADGVVQGHHVDAGALVEHGQVLAEIAG